MTVLICIYEKLLKEQYLHLIFTNFYGTICILYKFSKSRLFESLTNSLFSNDFSGWDVHTSTELKTSSGNELGSMMYSAKSQGDTHENIVSSESLHKKINLLCF